MVDNIEGTKQSKQLLSDYYTINEGSSKVNDFSLYAEKGQRMV